MRFFVALAFACGTLATAVQVQPLRTAAETQDMLSSEPDVQGAGFGIETAPEMAGYVTGKALGSYFIFKSWLSMIGPTTMLFPNTRERTLLIQPHI